LQIQQELQQMQLKLAALQSQLAGECTVFTPPQKVVVVAKQKV
jgi:hypothetical protein